MTIGVPAVEAVRVKALILYWSISGTTKRVAERIAEGLRAAGADCRLHDLRAGLPGDVSDHEIIGVGFPVHWYRPPTPVSAAMTALGRLDGRSVFAFSLNGTYRGAGLNRARSALARTGATEIGAFSCHGEGRFYPYARLGALFSPGHPTQPELDAARGFGEAMAAAHLTVLRGGPAPGLPRRDPPTHPMYALERLVSGPQLTRAVYSRLFRVDPRRCTRCGKCARECPTRNITWERGGFPSWGRDCVLCLNCVAACPAEAVACPLDWPVFRPFVRWNVERARRDPALEVARVELRHGTFRRV